MRTLTAKKPTGRQNSRRLRGQNPDSYKSAMYQVRAALNLSQSELAAALGWKRYQTVYDHEVKNTLPEDYETRQAFNILARKALGKLRAEADSEAMQKCIRVIESAL